MSLSLLRRSFSREEWEFLNQDPVFKELLSGKFESLDDYEAIAEVTDLLLKRRKDAVY